MCGFLRRKTGDQQEQDMDKILRGVMKYRHNVRQKMVEQFVRVRDNPVPTAIFFCCVDSRMLPTRFTQTNVGDMFIVRNAGNLIPHFAQFRDDTVSTEPAALELGCVLNRVQHIIVCGHSDCKAMNMLYDLRHSEAASLTNQRLSPMKAWLCRHGHSSLQRFEDFNKLGWDHPMTFLAETPMKRFIAYIDPINRFSITDKLSQISCLQQVQNIASYPFLKKGLEIGLIRIHAMWFDIYTGDIFFFSRRRKHFVEINEDTIDQLLADIT